MTSPRTSWPPLIVAGKVSRAIKWRDTGLTLLMWTIILTLLAREFGIEARALFGVPGLAPEQSVNWRERLAGMTLFLMTAAALASALALVGIHTKRSRRRALKLPQPQPLRAAEEAQRAGLDETALVAARRRKIMTVSVKPDGGLQIEP